MITCGRIVLFTWIGTYGCFLCVCVSDDETNKILHVKFIKSLVNNLVAVASYLAFMQTPNSDYFQRHYGGDFNLSVTLLENLQLF